MGASITSSSPQPVYQTQGNNFAPKKDLQELALVKRVSRPNELNLALLQKYQDYKNRDPETFIENCNTGEMVSNLRTGKLLLMRSVRDGRYLFVKREGKFSDNKTVGGQFQFYSTKLISEWLSSRPELEPICPSDDDQVEALISAVKVVEDYYATKFYTTDYETKECHSAQDFGTWITRYRFDPDKQDIVCELLPFPACRWDIRFRPEESSYFIYESKCATSVLEELLDAEVPEDGDDDNYGLQVIEQLARTGGNVSGQGKSNRGNYTPVPGESTVIEMWLQPEAYCDIELSEDTLTVGGQTIPKGRSLLKMFPKGMCVVGLDNMQTVWAIHAENHKDHIVSGIFHAQSFSGVGKGVTDAVDVMKEKNDLRSQLLAHTKSHSTPGFGYNSSMVTEEMARSIGKPRKNIPIDFTQAPDGVRTINDVIQAILPGNPASAAFEMDKELTSDLQIAFQVTDLSQNPVLGVQSNTATGDKIRDANAATVLVPQHLNKAESRKNGAVVIYNLFKRHFPDKPKWFANKTKNNITAGKYISGAQFEGVDIDFEIVSNSQIPKKPYAQEESLAKILQFTGGIGGLLEAAQLNPELTGEIVTGFGAKLSIPNQTDIARICRRRIEQAKQILGIEMRNQQLMSALGIEPNNSNLAAQVVSQISPPVSPFELYASLKAEWMADLLDSDELQDAPVELRYVIEELIARQLQTDTFGKAERAQDENLGAIIANLPSILGEQAMSGQAQSVTQEYEKQQAQAQAEAEQQKTAQTNQQQLQFEGQKAQIVDKAAEADHQRSMAMTDKTHAHQLQIEAIKTLAAKEAAKNQAKAKTAAR